MSRNSKMKCKALRSSTTSYNWTMLGCDSFINDWISFWLMHWSHRWYFFFILFIATISPRKIVDYEVTILGIDCAKNRPVCAITYGLCICIFFHLNLKLNYHLLKFQTSSLLILYTVSPGMIDDTAFF